MLALLRADTQVRPYNNTATVGCTNVLWSDLDAVRGTPGVLSSPAPDCVLVDFADSAVTYGLRYWIVDFMNRVPIESEVRTRIWYAAQQAGLEIPYPIRTIIVPPSERASAKVHHISRAQ